MTKILFLTNYGQEQLREIFKNLCHLGEPDGNDTMNLTYVGFSL